MDTLTAAKFGHDRCHLNYRTNWLSEILVDYNIVFVVWKFSLICCA
jgi:hypothetical protein